MNLLSLIESDALDLFFNMSKCWGLLLRSCAYKIIHRKKRSFEANILKENQHFVSAINGYKVQPRKVNPKIPIFLQ